MQTVNERLAALPELLGYESPAALAKASSLDPNTLRKAMSGPSKPGFDLLSSILGKHENLRAQWLMLGQGQPLTDMPATSTEPEGRADMPPRVPQEMQIPGDTPFTRVSRGGQQVDPYVDQLLERIAEQAKTIERLWGQNDKLLTRKTTASPGAASLRQEVDAIALETPAAYVAPGFRRAAQLAQGC